MKNIRISILFSTVERWLEARFFPPDTDVRLVWESGFDWGSVVDDIETNPTPWDPEAWERRKRQQERLERMVREEGLEAAQEWFKKVSGYEARENQ